MIINHFNTYPYGGAATAAGRIHEGLRQAGLNGENVNSRFLFHKSDKQQPADPSYVRLKFSEPPSTMADPLTRQFKKRRRKKIHRQYDTHLANRPSDLEVFSMADLPEPSRFDWEMLDGDIAHLHWISFFADYPSFFGSIPDKVPIIWTLHDMNAFSGGCHYAGECTRFKSGCGQCPQVVASEPKDVSYSSFKSKQKALRRKDITVVAPSRWLTNLASQSPIWPLGTTFHTINYGLDLNRWAPIDSAAAKQQLAIDSSAVLIGFGAESLSNRRKGFHHLIAALKRLKATNNVECIVFGSGEIPADPDLPTMHEMGFVEDQRTQAAIYSAADIVVVPSTEDNQPQVGLEAMACGTTVVGFDAGGIPEYVRDGVTGLVAKVGDENDLAAKLSQLVDDGSLRSRLSRAAREMMVEEFEMNKQTKAYLRLYGSTGAKQDVAA